MQHYALICNGGSKKFEGCMLSVNKCPFEISEQSDTEYPFIDTDIVHDNDTIDTIIWENKLNVITCVSIEQQHV